MPMGKEKHGFEKGVRLQEKEEEKENEEQKERKGINRKA